MSVMTTSKGTIQGYNGIVINDDKHQIILQAEVWGSVWEQQTLAPAIEQLEKQLTALGTPDDLESAMFTADSGFHSENNLKFMSNTGLDVYIADTAFRSRNPLFKTSETYHSEKEKRRLKRSKGRSKLFTSKDFIYDPSTMSCRCPAGKSLWISCKQVESEGRQYIRFAGHLHDCKACSLQEQCMRSPPKERGRQVQFRHDSAPGQDHELSILRQSVIK